MLKRNIPFLHMKSTTWSLFIKAIKPTSQCIASKWPMYQSLDPSGRSSFWRSWKDPLLEYESTRSGYGSIPMKIPFLLGWTSINPSYFDVNRRGTRFWHTAIWVFLLILLISKILLRSCLATKHAFYLSDSWWRSMTETVLHTVTPTHPESSVGSIPLGFQENMVNEQITTVLFTRVFWIITCI